jgi:hypothetical protein
MIGCQTGEHRKKAKGIHRACVEDLPVSDQYSDAHEYGRANHAHGRSYYMYDTVCREHGVGKAKQSKAQYRIDRIGGRLPA